MLTIYEVELFVLELSHVTASEMSGGWFSSSKEEVLKEFFGGNDGDDFHDQPGP